MHRCCCAAVLFHSILRKKSYCGFSSSLLASSFFTLSSSFPLRNNNDKTTYYAVRHFWMYDDTDDEDDDDYVSPRKKMSFDGPVNQYGIPESFIQTELQKVEHALQYAEQEPYGPDRGIWSIHEYYGYSDPKKLRPRFKKKKARNLLIRLIHRRHALRLGHYGLRALPCRVITESFLGPDVPHNVRISRPKARDILLELWFDGYSELIEFYKVQIELKKNEPTRPPKKPKTPEEELFLFGEYAKKMSAVDNAGVESIESKQSFDEQFGEKEETDEEFKIDDSDEEMNEEEVEDEDEDEDAKIRWSRRWRH